MLHDLRAVHTGELGPNVPDDLEMARHKVEHLRDVFAEPAHCRATLGTMAALRWMHYCPARQIGRQRTRCARFTRCTRLRLRRLIGGVFARHAAALLDRGLRLHHIFELGQIVQPELRTDRLIDLLGRATEAPALQSRDLLDQASDQRLAPAPRSSSPASTRRLTKSPSISRSGLSVNPHSARLARIP